MDLRKEIVVLPDGADRPDDDLDLSSQLGRHVRPARS